MKDLNGLKILSVTIQEMGYAAFAWSEDVDSGFWLHKMWSNEYQTWMR